MNIIISALVNMDKNKIFSLLLVATGFNKNIPAFIKCLNERGYSPISENQIRSWRRSEGKGRPVPDFVLEVIFETILKQKEIDNRFFSLVTQNEQKL
ncbi:hypothetical protein FHQ26_00490 [Testudinibacter sp. TR-2022]|uniref:hypothetical protein n=1 Tax=Testudinibacter sp. TR-2022 TaxID=2585029 RepID=UPI00111B8683|nr:hypothetical protein [Testudinibacter sp. TR-2022]TNH06696.1 hypothetical protein FHQ25_12105 [Testudinibacter sp. TR-2022]TNH13014.1 hypothetical protein FHQ26_00490 [Testudinibacter sp. TR-2022]